MEPKPFCRNDVFEVYIYAAPVLEIIMANNSGWIVVEDEGSAEMLRDALEKFLEGFGNKENGNEQTQDH